jgi:hypothetical protein
MARQKHAADWLDRLFANSGKSKGELALRLNLPPSAISKLLKGDRQFKVAELGPTAAFFGISRDRLNELMGGGLPDVMPALPIEYQPGSQTLPVYGVVEMDSGTFDLADSTRSMGRPQELENVPTAFGVYVATDNMAPALDRGDIAIIDPSKPVAERDLCLFVSADGKRRTIRRLVGVTERDWRVEQYNPGNTGNLPRKDWPKAQRIFGVRKRGS